VWIAAAVIVVIAVIIVVALQRPSDVAVGSPSPTVSAKASASATTAATATTTTSGSPAASQGGTIYNDDFGFVVNDVGTAPTVQPSANAHIRSESSGASIASFVHEGFWVSPDGTQIAYWSARSPGQPSQLVVARAANPQSVIASSSLSAGENGGRIIWGNDSSAVAYVIYGPAPATTGTIRTFNTRPGSAGPGQVVFQFTEAGKNITPIAWDRAANMLAVGVSVTGTTGVLTGVLTDYIIVDSATPGANAKRTPVSGRIAIGLLEGSSDAKYILGVDADTGFSYWPLASISSKVTPAEAKYGQAGVAWRPGTHQIGFIGPSNQFWLCDVERNTPLGCGTTAFSGVTSGASLRTYRADGSAVLLAVPGGAQTSYTLVRFGGDPKATSGDRVTFQDSDGLRASVRLR
jgi:hypothetical protein